MREVAALARCLSRAAVPGLLLVLTAPVAAQYKDHRALATAVSDLAARHRSLASAVTIATSPGGRAVQALRIGAAGRPALLVIANAYGPHLIGSEVAIAAAERILGGGSGDLLAQATIWFIPRLNPDAAEGMFSRPVWPRTGNGMATDEDRDWQTDEDPFDDLNGDGVITAMRVADPNGEWLQDPDEPGLMRRADATKGEVGRWSMLIEGRDDDDDGQFNEDGPGGVDVNRNFPYNYAHHGREAGRFPMETPEARGLADFLIAHPEIAAVYVLGPQDNLLKPWENRANAGIMNPTTRERAAEGTSAGGPLNSILRADQSTFTDVSRRFHATTGLTKGPSSAGLAGDVLSWSYFDFGRWAFGSRGWWAPDAPRDTAHVPASRPGAGGASGTDGNADERNAIKWYRAQGIEVMVPWTPVTIPGERRTIEVGGIKPGVLLNPPPGAEMDSTLARQTRFVAELAGMLPRIAFRDLEVSAVGDGVWRISVDLANEGTLPTNTSLGARMRNPRNIRVALGLGGATLLSGEAITIAGPIAGGGRSTTLTWTVAATRGATLSLSAESPTTGAATQSIPLR